MSRGDYDWTMRNVKTLRATRRCMLKGTLLLSCVLVLSPVATGEVTPAQCVMITRAKLQKMLGRPVKCRNVTGDVECFGHELQPVRVVFNESGVAKRIELHTGCNGIYGLKDQLNKIVPEKARGKFRQRNERPRDGSCEMVYEEEYECLKIKYREELCRGCAPASITVEWKE